MEVRSDRHSEACKRAGRSIKRTLQHRHDRPAEADAGTVREPSLFRAGEGHEADEEQRAQALCLPSGVRAAARAEGSLAQNREALAGTKAPRISARSVKSRGVRESDGSGRSSGDAEGQHNPGGAKGPWVRVVPKGWRGRTGHAGQTVRITGGSRARSQQGQRVCQTAVGTAGRAGPIYGFRDTRA